MQLKIFLVRILLLVSMLMINVYFRLIIAVLGEKKLLVYSENIRV